jgi:GMC oxidoreductase/FAD binding domain
MMHTSNEHSSTQAAEYDVVIVGSGTSGATLARELSAAGQKVLVLERGGDRPLNEKISTILAIADEVKLGDEGLSGVRGLVAGGSSGLYFGLAEYPPLDVFESLGIDLAPELEPTKALLNSTTLPDSFLGAKPSALRDAATSLGYEWQKRDMLVDFARCDGPYSYDAKWKARVFLDEAIRDGATLITGATVGRILFENARAVGVEYRSKGRFGSEMRRVHGRRIVLAAGEFATPQLLRDNGVDGVGARGFYCNPGYALYGIVPGLRGGDGFVGSSYCTIAPGIELGDANIHRSLHWLMMLGGMKLRHMFSFPSVVGLGVKVKDGLSGELRADGSLHKTIEPADREKLDKGRREAVRVLEKAGAQRIVDFGMTAAGRVGGLVRIGEHVDHRFETQFRGLHVCDGSVIPDEMRGAPTVTLVCMARHLAKTLLAEERG